MQFGFTDFDEVRTTNRAYDKASGAGFHHSRVRGTPNLEQQAAEPLDIWTWCLSPQERINYIRKHRPQFRFDSYGQMVDVVRGHCFSGCASELIKWRNRFRANTWRAVVLFCVGTWAFLIYAALRMLDIVRYGLEFP